MALTYSRTHSKVISVDLPYFAAGVGAGYEVAKKMTQGYSLEDLRATRKVSIRLISFPILHT